jgi:small nuclear ribonucleoprotein (snRNP)-like protein
MDKKLFLQLNGQRKVTGILRGFDPFLNIVLDQAVEETRDSQKVDIGTVVRQASMHSHFYASLVRLYMCTINILIYIYIYFIQYYIYTICK